MLTSEFSADCGVEYNLIAYQLFYRTSRASGRTLHRRIYTKDEACVTLKIAMLPRKLDATGFA